MTLEVPLETGSMGVEGVLGMGQPSSPGSVNPSFHGGTQHHGGTQRGSMAMGNLSTHGGLPPSADAWDHDLVLAGDVGGTNSRFMLYEANYDMVALPGQW
jgi:hypothetical protein